MAHFLLGGHNLAKTFGDRTIFHGLQLRVETHEALGITGRNGSGKTTLAKIIAGVLSPSSGVVEFSVDGVTIDSIAQHEVVGFVGPYLQLYDEFTGWENLDIVRAIRGIKATDDELAGLLDLVSLTDRKDGLVRTYSSGMRQRLKYACALLHSPPLLVLDEPASNLDAEGTEIVRRIMKAQVQKGILVVAANEREDLFLCKETIDLNLFDRRRIPA